MSFVQSGFDDGGWRKLDLPHDWAIEGPFLKDGPNSNVGRLKSWGALWYRKALEIPAQDKGKSIFTGCRWRDVIRDRLVERQAGRGMAVRGRRAIIWCADLPFAHILPHWTWPERVGQVTPVHVFASGDEAELFVTGKSQGRIARVTARSPLAPATATIFIE